MSKIINLLKIYKLLILGLVLGIIISITTIYYANPSFDSINVKYNNQTSGMSSTNTKAAIDELASKAKKNEIIERLAATNSTVPGLSPTGTYSTCSDSTYSSYTCSTRTTNYSYSTSGSFEMAFDSWMYNQTAAMMGGHVVKFKNGSTEVASIHINDSWSGYVRVALTAKAGSQTVSQEQYTTGVTPMCGDNAFTTTTRYSLIRDSSAGYVTLYRGSCDMGSVPMSGTVSITSVEVFFLKYGSYVTVPTMVSNIYIGPIRS